MKYLKTFESYSEKGLAQEIAEDILPKLQEIKKEKGIFTVGMFDNYMEERKGDMKLTDEVMSELVNMGFDFDSDDDDDFYFVEDDEEGDVPPPPPGFEGYPGMEYSLN
jgi:hypothetical protein